MESDLPECEERASPIHGQRLPRHGVALKDARRADDCGVAFSRLTAAFLERRQRVLGGMVSW